MSDERRPLLMRVLDAMQEADNYYVSADQAQVAIALIRAETLEKAAKVADDLSDRWTKEWRAGLKADSRLEALSDGADDVAFAIRALNYQTTT